MVIRFFLLQSFQSVERLLLSNPMRSFVSKWLTLTIYIFGSHVVIICLPEIFYNYDLSSLTIFSYLFISVTIIIISILYGSLVSVFEQAKVVICIVITKDNRYLRSLVNYENNLHYHLTFMWKPFSNKYSMCESLHACICVHTF